MGQLLKDDNTKQSRSSRQVLESKFASARHNILLIVVFTAINIFLLVTNSNTYFLFSAYIPYILVDFGMLFCGMYPSEFYTGEFGGMEFLDKSFFAITLGVAVVILVLYLLSWILSKKDRVGWMIFALVFFSIDTVLMFLLNGIAMESIIDVVFHGWVIYSLASGVHAYYKGKKIPLEEPVAEESNQTITPAVEVDTTEQTDSI